MERVPNRHGYNTWLVVIDGEAFTTACYEYELWLDLMDDMGYEFYKSDVQVYIL